MSAKRYPEDFKIEAVAQRLGVTVKSMHDWINKYGSHTNQHQTVSSQQDEISLAG